MIRYIDSKEVLDAINGHMWKRQEDKDLATAIVKNTPTEDPVKHGHWIDVKGEDIYGEHYQFYKCSRCQCSNKTLFRYCPECGAMMDWARIHRGDSNVDGE